MTAPSAVLSMSTFLPTPSARRATAHIPVIGGDHQLFLPTPSARRATSTKRPRWRQPSDFYPRPPRGGRLDAYNNCNGRCDISTHALREEGDGLAHDDPIHIGISTHALREEGDPSRRSPRPGRSGISTHALREEGDCGAVDIHEANAVISTHALREEGDR